MRTSQQGQVREPARFGHTQLPVGRFLKSLDWTEDARSRIGDEGHVFHVEAFVVPANGRMPSLDQLKAARRACIDLDWKVQDMVLVPVAELPAELLPGPPSPSSER